MSNVDERRAHESQILDLTRRVAGEFEDALRLRGLCCVIATAQRVGSVGGADYSSEVNILIRDKDGALVDVVEFHVFRMGAAVASEAETGLWLREALGEYAKPIDGHTGR